MEPHRPDYAADADANSRLGLLGNGSILLARDALEDPNFAAAIVLLCDYDTKSGAYGLVLNRPSHMPLSEMFDGFTDVNMSREVYIGGPVQQGELQVLQITDSAHAESRPVAPRVHLGGKWESLDSILALDPDATYLFLGYSGWAPGQLENEILAGAWDVYRVDVEKLLANKQHLLSADIDEINAYLNTLKIR